MVASLYMAEAGLLAGLELVARLVLVLVHVLQEVRSQGRRGWMRKIGVDHNKKYKKGELLTTSPVETGVKENHICVFGWEETVNL